LGNLVEISLYKQILRVRSLGANVLPTSPADFAKLIVDETEKWGKVIKVAGLRPGNLARPNVRSARLPNRA